MNIQRRSRNVLLGLGLVLLSFVALFAMAGGMMEHGFAGGYGARPFLGGGPWLWGIGLIGMVIRLAVWGALIVLAVNLFRRWSAHSDGYMSHSQMSSIEILRRRYAAGEINREQFEEMRRVLEPEIR